MITLNSKLKKYCIEQLASTGFVLLDSRTAFALRGDLWASPNNCVCDLNIDKGVELGLSQMGAMLFQADAAGIEFRGATRSAMDLCARIEFITGVNVENIRFVDSFVDEHADKMDRLDAPLKPDNTEELIELAAMELPTHECALRQKILRARSELAERGVVS